MNNYEKVVPPQFEKLFNFRDIGGLKTDEGAFMRKGILFRSDHLSKVTDNDSVLLRKFKIKVICDLRTSKECYKRPTPLSLAQGTNLINISLHNYETHDINWKKLVKYLFSKSGKAEFQEFRKNYYHHIAFDRTTQIKEIINVISSKSNLPAIIHCTAGRDRTGYIAALIQLLVGVPYETVVQEYLKTNQYYEFQMEKLIKVAKLITFFQVSPDRLRFMLMAQRVDFDDIFETIARNYGSIETYITEACRIEQDKIDRLKELLLE